MIMDKVVNITVAGLGGQGVLKITDIMAEVLFEAGYDVKKSEVHGMSQRGGSVSSEVRYGKEVFSPMVPEGESDLLAVMDATQVEVNIAKLKDGGELVVIDELPVKELASPKAANMLMLGALSRRFENIGESLWLKHMFNNLPAKVHAVNEAAFKLGRG